MAVRVNNSGSVKHHSVHHRRVHVHSRHMEDIQKAVLAGEQLENPPVRPKDDKMDNLHSKERGGSLMMLTCFLGIFVSYFVYGLLQEKITKQKFDDENFHYFMFLVGTQCVVNAMFAKGVTLVRGVSVSLAPHRLFSVLAFTYVGAMVASNSSLSFIAYPTQVLGKCAKPIPILIMGVALGQRSYPLIKYLIVLLIVAGVALFLFKDKGDHTLANESDQRRLFDLIGIGEFLLIISLFFDGLTGVFQDKLKAKHDITAHHMMYAVNAYSVLFLAVGMFLSGEGRDAVEFIQRHPHVIFNISAFGLASAVGQNFIFLTITHFGPLTCSIFTTTRKFFTILGSVLIFSNPLLPRQWVGMVLVFLGLGLDTYFGKATKNYHHHHHHHSVHHPETKDKQLELDGPPVTTTV